MTDNSPFSTTLDSRIELKIPASAQWVRVARLTVAGVASRLHFGIKEIEDIKLAVSEAINNAILHASVEPGSEAMVTITLESDENGLWVSVADEGRVQGGIDAPQPPRRALDDNLPESGMGLLLIQSLMDEVTHESGAHSDTIVRMFKRLPEKDARDHRTAPRRA